MSCFERAAAMREGIFCAVPLQEGLTGKTIGKRIVRIKVNREDTLAPAVSASVIRHLCEVIDSLFLIGLVLAARSGRKQRLGDRAAKTFVVLDNI